jgi:MFS family permease
MLIFANASGVAALIVARVTQGVSTGAAVGAVGAGLLDLDRAKGTLANAVGPVTGTAVGGITSGLMVQYLPAPTQLIYFVLLGVFLVQALGVAFMPETSALKPGALASLRPHLRVPSALRQPVLIVAPALVAAWALAGFYGSLAPTLIRRLVGTTSTLFGGVALFVLASSAGIAVLVLRERTQRTLMTFGSSALLLGVALTLLAIDAASLALFLLGTSVAGMGFGAAFQGALRGVIPLAAPDERAGVLSVLYIISYLAMGLPAVLGGILVVYAGGLVSTTREYGASIMLLAAMALAGTFSTARKIATAPLLGRTTRAPRAQRGHA